jgi:hypothetical protein
VVVVVVELVTAEDSATFDELPANVVFFFLLRPPPSVEFHRFLDGCPCSSMAWVFEEEAEEEAGAEEEAAGAEEEGTSRTKRRG